MKLSSLLLAMTILVTFSCNQDEINVHPSKTDRLSFEGMEEFRETYLSLAQISSIEELEQWANNRNHSTLLHSEDRSLINYSDAFKTILNKDFEYQIGQNIIWFHDGILYSFSQDQIPNLNVLKKDPANCAKFGEVRSMVIENSHATQDVRTATTDLPFDGLDARNQKEFSQRYYQPCGSTRRSLEGKRKYVHEIYDETFLSYPGPVRFSFLYLRIKLEYKNRKGRWKPAGEQRETRIQVSGNVHIPGTPVTSNFSINTSRDCYSGNWATLILDPNHGPDYLLGSPRWVVSMRGSIYHRVKGDNASNAWTNTEYAAGSGYLW